MKRLQFFRSVCLGVVLVFAGQTVCTADTLEQRAATAVALFDGAERRFQPLDAQWFASTRQALAEETQRVDKALESHGQDYAAAWKKHLRWPLLTGNLGEVSQVNLAELALVRRWLFSNRKGLEYPFFAQLRVRADAHLDAVYTFSQPNLESMFIRQVALVRERITALADDPTDSRAAALGRTLGWFERTRQLPEETAAARSLLSYPNAQIVVARPLIDRAIALLATDVDQSLPVSDRVEVPNGRLFRRPRTANVRGMAHTHGQIALELVANRAFADVQLVYQGEISSSCRAVVGPVAVAMRTAGPVRAVTPIELSLHGVKLLATEVIPQVQTNVTGVSADRELIRRLGERRAHEPESIRRMNSRARQKATTLLRDEMDARVTTAINEIRAELSQAQKSLNSFQEVVAPVAREGATPRWEGLQSTTEGVIVNAVSQRREQFGAASPCPLTSDADLQMRVHVSLMNNMAETIMAGKTFTDKYFMNYGKILQAELPPPLMVHARSVRWAVVAAKPRPLEFTIPDRNQFEIQLTMQRVEIGEDIYTGPTVATMHYRLVQNEFDEYQLERQGEVELDSPMPEEGQVFLLQKLSAFFAPVLNAGGVALPEGGTLGRLRGLKSRGVLADHDWLTLGIQVPVEVLELWLPVADD